MTKGADTILYGIMVQGRRNVKFSHRAEGAEECCPSDRKRSCREFTDCFVCRFDPETLPKSFEASYEGENAIHSDMIVTLIRRELSLANAKLQMLWLVEHRALHQLGTKTIDEEQVIG